MRVIPPLRELIAFESAGGILLAIAAAAALILAILDDIGAIVIIAMFYAGNLAPVAFAFLPLFAFANVGVSLEGVTAATFLEPVPLGIAAGLLAGKPIGVFLVSWLTVRLGILFGSLASALLGLAILRAVLPLPTTAR